MYSKFDYLLQKNNVTTYQVAKATKISNVTFTDWKKGRSKPKADKLLKIAQYFDVSIEYFLDKGDETNE